MTLPRTSFMTISIPFHPLLSMARRARLTINSWSLNPTTFARSRIRQHSTVRHRRISGSTELSQNRTGLFEVQLRTIHSLCTNTLNSASVSIENVRLEKTELQKAHNNSLELWLHSRDQTTQWWRLESAGSRHVDPGLCGNVRQASGV